MGREEQVTFLGESAQCGSNNISQHQRRFAQETPVQYLNVGNSLDMGAQKMNYVNMLFLISTPILPVLFFLSVVGYVMIMVNIHGVQAPVRC